MVVRGCAQPPPILLLVPPKVLLFALLMGCVSVFAASPERASGGVVVRLESTPLGQARRVVANQPVRLDFVVTDISDTPFSGLHPQVRARLRAQRASPDCGETSPSLDLGAPYLVVLGQNAQIIQEGRLLQTLPLSAMGGDWVWSSLLQRLIVVEPLAGQITFFDSEAWTQVATLALPQPDRIQLQPDGGYAWVSYGPMQEQRLAVVDPLTGALITSLHAGPGPLSLAFSADSHVTYVRTKDTLTAIDTHTLSPTTRLSVGDGQIAWSAAAHALYLSDPEGISALDGPQIRESGGGPIHFLLGGRYGLIPQADQLLVLDASVNQIVGAVDLRESALELAFTKDFVYVREATGVEVFPVRALHRLREPWAMRFFPVPYPSNTAGHLPTIAGLPTTAVRAGTVAVLADEQIDVYDEATAQLVISLPVESARSLRWLDRGMREAQAGHYQIAYRFPEPGIYDLIFSIDTPGFTGCFPLRVGL